MLTCFLFAKEPTEDSVLSLRLDAQGQIESPLMHRSVEELRVLQLHAKTILVLPASLASIHEVQLPWLSYQKSRAAIPYALEEELVQSVSELHFCFDKQHYQNNHYLVVVIAKSIIQSFMAFMDEHQLSYEAITLDWFALNEGEGCVMAHQLLFYHTQFKGALGMDVFERCSQDPAYFLTWYGFDNSLPDMPELTRPNESFHTWVAQRLWVNKAINLCQGDMQHNTRQRQVLRWYQAALCLAGAWLVIWVVIKAVLLGMASHQNAILDKDIAKVYHEFFPHSVQVVSPKFRVEQWLKQHQGVQAQLIWQLLEKLSVAVTEENKAVFAANKDLKSDALVVKKLMFQNKSLTLTLQCESFSVLEKIEQKLRRLHVTVVQHSASTEDKHVLANLELS